MSWQPAHRQHLTTVVIAALGIAALSSCSDRTDGSVATTEERRTSRTFSVNPVELAPGDRFQVELLDRFDEERNTWEGFLTLVTTDPDVPGDLARGIPEPLTPTYLLGQGDPAEGIEPYSSSLAPQFEFGFPDVDLNSWPIHQPLEFVMPLEVDAGDFLMCRAVSSISPSQYADCTGITITASEASPAVPEEPSTESTRR
jgi:hypothetical protein